MKKKENIEKDTPLATIVLSDYKNILQDYKLYNKKLSESNKRMAIIIIILIILLAIAVTYIILTWDICNPDTGLFRNTC